MQGRLNSWERLVYTQEVGGSIPSPPISRRAKRWSSPASAARRVGGPDRCSTRFRRNRGSGRNRPIYTEGWGVRSPGRLLCDQRRSVRGLDVPGGEHPQSALVSEGTSAASLSGPREHAHTQGLVELLPNEAADTGVTGRRIQGVVRTRASASHPSWETTTHRGWVPTSRSARLRGA